MLVAWEPVGLITLAKVHRFFNSRRNLKLFPDCNGRVNESFVKIDSGGGKEDKLQLDRVGKTYNSRIIYVQRFGTLSRDSRLIIL